MIATADRTDPLAAVQQLTLAHVERRLADLDAERAALAVLRRSLAARDRVLRRRAEQGPIGEASRG